MNVSTEIPKEKINALSELSEEKTISSKKMNPILILSKTRVSVLVLLSVFLVAAGVYWYILEYHQKYVDESSAVYSYSSEAALAYNVFYVPNPVVTEASLGEDKAYISAFVDYVDSVINYEFSADKAADINITYSVTAYLQGVLGGLNEDMVLWSKPYELLPQQTYSENNSKAVINFEIPIRLDDVTQYVNQVKKILNISSDAKLTVLYNISIEAKTDEGTVYEELAPSLVIPISDKYFKITKNSVEKKTGTIDKSEKIISPIYETMRLCCWILMSLSFLSLLFFFIFTRNLVLSPQQKKIDRLFKKYGSRIVELDSDIKNGTKELIEVLSFDGLIRTADDLGKPVFYKNNGAGDAYCNFYVVDESTNYIFNPWNNKSKSD